MTAPLGSAYVEITSSLDNFERDVKQGIEKILGKAGDDGGRQFTRRFARSVRDRMKRALGGVGLADFVIDEAGVVRGKMRVFTRNLRAGLSRGLAGVSLGDAIIDEAGVLRGKMREFTAGLRGGFRDGLGGLSLAEALTQDNAVAKARAQAFADRISNGVRDRLQGVSFADALRDEAGVLSARLRQLDTDVGAKLRSLDDRTLRSLRNLDTRALQSLRNLDTRVLGGLRNLDDRVISTFRRVVPAAARAGRDGAVALVRNVGRGLSAGLGGALTNGFRNLPGFQRLGRNLGGTLLTGVAGSLAGGSNQFSRLFSKAFATAGRAAGSAFNLSLRGAIAGSRAVGKAAAGAFLAPFNAIKRNPILGLALVGAPAAIIAIGPQISSLLSSLKDLGGLLGIIPPLVVGAVGAFVLFAGQGEKVKAAFEPLTEAFRELRELAIGDFLGPVSDSVERFSGTIAALLSGGFRGFASGLGNLVASGLSALADGNIGGNLSATLSNLGAAFTAFGETALRPLLLIFSQIAAQVSATLPGLFTELGTFLSDLAINLADFDFGNAFRTAVTAAIDLGGAVVNLVQLVAGFFQVMRGDNTEGTAFATIRARLQELEDKLADPAVRTKILGFFEAFRFGLAIVKTLAESAFVFVAELLGTIADPKNVKANDNFKASFERLRPKILEVARELGKVVGELVLIVIQYGPQFVDLIGRLIDLLSEITGRIDDALNSPLARLSGLLARVTFGPLVAGLNVAFDAINALLGPLDRVLTALGILDNTRAEPEVRVITTGGTRTFTGNQDLRNNPKDPRRRPSRRGVQEFADGGLVNRPTYALVGEAGPEVVLPLSRPRRMAQLMKEAGLTATSTSTSRTEVRAPITLNVRQALDESALVDLLEDRLMAAVR